MPIPTCVVGKDGKVVDANELMGEVIVYSDIVGANFFTLTGIKFDDLRSTIGSDEEITVSRNEKVFKLAIPEEKAGQEEITVYFVEITKREKYRKL